MATTQTLHAPPEHRPSGDPIQRNEALRLANTIRLHRSEVKRHIADGTLNIVDLLEGPIYDDAQLLGLRVEQLLMAVPRFGRFRVNRTVTQAGLPLTKTLRALTPRQRNMLLAEVIKHVPHTRSRGGAR